MKSTFAILFALYFIIINFIAYILMGIDKKKAVQKAYRIPERTLFVPVLLGGGLGGTLGMHRFHHKTKHWYFAIGFPLIMLAEYTTVIAFLIRFAGF